MLERRPWLEQLQQVRRQPRRMALPDELELEEVGAALRLHTGLHARILVPHHRVAVVAHGGGFG